MRPFQDKPCLNDLVKSGYKTTGLVFRDVELYKKGNHRVGYNFVHDKEDYSYIAGELFEKFEKEYEEDIE